MGKTILLGAVAGLGVWWIYKKTTAATVQSGASSGLLTVDRSKVPSIIPRLIYTTKGAALELKETPQGTIQDTYGNIWI